MARISRLSSFLHDPSPNLTLLSWNILCPGKAPQRKYHHVPEQWLHWSNRRTRLLAELERTRADIVCLQEVELDVYERDLCPYLSGLGYASSIMKDKKGHSDRGFEATFWLQDRLSLVENSTFSRSHSFACLLQDMRGRRLAVVNVHLEGHPRQTVERVRQLERALLQVRDLSLRDLSPHAVLVSGDFNCEGRASACGAYLAFGQVPDGVMEFGRLVPKEASQVPRHVFSLASAFMNAPFEEFSFTLYGRKAFFLDQMWYSTQSLELLCTRSPFESDEHRREILRTGLPSAAEPSDHLPIAAAFRWTPDPEVLQVAPPPQTEVQGVEELLQEASELQAAAPLTDEQRAEWAVLSNIPELPKEKKQRPTPELLAEVQALSQRKKVFFQSLDEETRQMLTRVQQLQRKAKKAAMADAGRG